MKHILTIISVFVLLLSACTKPTTLEEKKEALANYRDSLSTIQAKIDALEAEILVMDSSVVEQASSVIATTVENKTFKNPFRIQGVVSSNQNVGVSAEMGGTVTAVVVKEGQRVSKGQVIARLDGSSVSSQIAELESALGLAKITFEKQDRLWKQNIGSEMQYLQAKNNYEGLQRRISSAQVQLGKFVIKSPITGTVDEIFINAGEITGGGRPVARIVSSGDVKIIAEVSENYIGKLKKGDEVSVFFPSLNKTITEKIFAVGNYISPENRTFSVVIKPTTRGISLAPNLLGIITAFDYVEENAISIATKLIRDDGAGKYIMVAEKDDNGLLRAERRSVEVSQAFADYSVIGKGLKTGDVVITEGYSTLSQGQLIKTVD